MSNEQLKWVYLIILSIIWGSSFVLMKLGMDHGVTATQLGATRVIFTGIFLLLIGSQSLVKIKKHHWKWVVVSGLLGTFIPVFMFAYAETQIDSSIASILNSFTPLNTLIFGFWVFNMKFNKNQLLGVVVGLIGTLLLIFAGANVNPDQNYFYALFVVVASICYAFNVNIIKEYLQDLNPLSIATGNFVVIIIPALFILFGTGFFEQEITLDSEIAKGLGYILILAVFGTGIAKVMFNKLVQIATPVFATSVTYTIPVVALILGIWYGEKLSFLQIMASCIILLGVYLANRKK